MSEPALPVREEGRRPYLTDAPVVAQCAPLSPDRLPRPCAVFCVRRSTQTDFAELIMDRNCVASSIIRIVVAAGLVCGVPAVDFCCRAIFSLR
jgi:hypothetical protein